MADFKVIPTRPMVGVFDTLSSSDEVGYGNWRVVKNATTRSTRNRQRGGGWRRAFADIVPYNNQDLHDQLTDRLSYYDSYFGHAMGGGGVSGYGYPYFVPAYTQDDFTIQPPASQMYCGVYIGDYPYYEYNGCDVFYPFIGFPHRLLPASPEICNTGAPDFYAHSFLYTSCQFFYDEVDFSGYFYGPPFAIYSSQFSYDFIYCGTTVNQMSGCREAVTMLNEIVTSTGRKLIAATMSRVYELNQSSGNWRILAAGLGNAGYSIAQCGCNDTRGISATMGGYLMFTNNFDQPTIYFVGDPAAGCGLDSLQIITDLDALNITRAGGVVSWKGFSIFFDLTEDGNRYGGDVIWSDLEDPSSYIESDTSFAGRATIAVGETILAAAPIGNWLIFYTDKSIIRCTLVGGEDVFNFENIYGAKQGGNALKYKFSLINCGDTHLYLGESDVYMFTQFDTRPISVNWITRAAGMIFNGIEEDDASYQPINKDACHMVTGGWSDEKREAWLSWATGDNTCPDVTLRFNLKFNTADFVDHGFTSYLTFRPDGRPTIGQWIEDMGICPRGTQVATGLKDGPTCDSSTNVVENPPLYIRNQEEDPDRPVHPDSLCARLAGKSIDDFCSDCAAPTRFLSASAEDFTIKQQEDDIYYRERLGFGGTPCQDFNFTTESGETDGFSGTPIVLDTWMELGGQVNCQISGVSVVTKAGVVDPPDPPDPPDEPPYIPCEDSPATAYSDADETGKILPLDSRNYEIAYIESIDRVAADSEDDTGIAIVDFTAGTPVLDYVLPIAGDFRIRGLHYVPEIDVIVALISYGTGAPPFTYRVAFFDPVTGFIDEFDPGLTGGSNLYNAIFCPISKTKIGVLFQVATHTQPHLIATIDVSTRSLVASQFYEGTGGIQPTRNFYGLCYSCELEELVTSNNKFTGVFGQNYITRIDPDTLAINSEVLIASGPTLGVHDMAYVNSSTKVIGWDSSGYYEVTPSTGVVIQIFATLPNDAHPMYHWWIDRILVTNTANNVVLLDPSDYSQDAIGLTNDNQSSYFAVQRNGTKFYIHDAGSPNNIHELDVT